jgi:hypothetical protein
MKTTASTMIALFALGILGCGGSVSTSQGGEGAGGGGTQGTGGGTQGTGGGTQGTGGAGDGSCSADHPCATGVCIFDGTCGPAAKGTCQYGYSCDGPPTGPVCGCDGNVIEGEMAICSAWGSGAPYSVDPTPCATGTFACGDQQCTNNVEFCVVTTGGPADSPPSYQCVPVAQAQGTCSYGIADCSCLALQQYGCQYPGSCCTSDANHQETVHLLAP